MSGDVWDQGGLNALDLHSKITRFESRPGHRPSWLWLFVHFLSPSTQLPDRISLGHDRYLPKCFPIHCSYIILPSDALQSSYRWRCKVTPKMLPSGPTSSAAPSKNEELVYIIVLILIDIFVHFNYLTVFIHVYHQGRTYFLNLQVYILYRHELPLPHIQD
jgi:hypothetical protein